MYPTMSYGQNDILYKNQKCFLFGHFQNVFPLEHWAIDKIRNNYIGIIRHEDLRLKWPELLLGWLNLIGTLSPSQKPTSLYVLTLSKQYSKQFSFQAHLRNVFFGASDRT